MGSPSELDKRRIRCRVELPDVAGKLCPVHDHMAAAPIQRLLNPSEPREDARPCGAILQESFNGGAICAFDLLV